MNKLVLTYLLGFDYFEVNPFKAKSSSIESIKNELNEVLLPDSIKINNQKKVIVFTQNLRPRFESEFRPIFFIYKIESSLSELRLDRLETKFYLDGSAKVQSFFSSFLMLILLAFLLSQKYLSYSESIIAWKPFIWLLLVAIVILKLILSYFIFADIDDYKRKLSNLAI